MTLKSHIALGGDLMKTELKLAVILTAATLICGCASGGGGTQHGETSPRPDSSTADTRTSNCVGFGCLLGGSGPSSSAQDVQEVNASNASTNCWIYNYCPDEVGAAAGTGANVLQPRFETWSKQLPSYDRGPLVLDSQYDAVRADLTYWQPANGSVPSVAPGSIFSTKERPMISEAWSGGPVYRWDKTLVALPFPESDLNQRDPLHSTFNITSFGQSTGDVRGAFDVANEWGKIPYSPPWAANDAALLFSPFTSILTQNVALVANPYKFDWNYQSFGVWNHHTATFNPTITLLSFGAATPGWAVPTGGSATFAGKLAGLYVSPTGEGSIATADFSINANFSTRSLSLASSGTTLTRELSALTPVPNLNLSGTLTYSPGSGTFNGTLANAGGTMSGSSKGQFYGPAAQELGGVFTVKSSTGVETLAGAYGAKR